MKTQNRDIVRDALKMALRNVPDQTTLSLQKKALTALKNLVDKSELMERVEQLMVEESVIPSKFGIPRRC